MHDPRMTHLQAVDRIQQYLKSTTCRKLLFKREETYANAEYAESANNGSSITGYYVFLGRDIVAWRSKKQYVVAHSRTGYS